MLKKTDIIPSRDNKDNFLIDFLPIIIFCGGSLLGLLALMIASLLGWIK